MDSSNWVGLPLGATLPTLWMFAVVFVIVIVYGVWLMVKRGLKLGQLKRRSISIGPGTLRHQPRLEFRRFDCPVVFESPSGVILYSPAGSFVNVSEVKNLIEAPSVVVGLEMRAFLGELGTEKLYNVDFNVTFKLNPNLAHQFCWGVNLEKKRGGEWQAGLVEQARLVWLLEDRLALADFVPVPGVKPSAGCFEALQKILDPTVVSLFGYRMTSVEIISTPAELVAIQTEE